MSRDTTSLFIEDLSQFTKTLRAHLSTSSQMPSHLSLLGLIAKAAGQKNHQSLKAANPASNPAPPKQSLPMKRALRVFDEHGSMIRWPKQTQVQGLCLWVFWADLPPGVAISEPRINEILKSGSGFGDHVLMRRSLIDHGLARRETDGRAYYRVEQKPPSDALQLIRDMRGRKST
ncbi:DUF2087 domain-containing protein [Halocynthiibacter namhaensis]|uniref:DUF2087 domain-containing protein n=1 Tax=Halocynthiibacter namhaensis TaxID=1290553 RepID=UPI0005799295|nr:DUF2087 domain-containing protein [Halocynthiibacter namhaensis]